MSLHDYQTSFLSKIIGAKDDKSIHSAFMEAATTREYIAAFLYELGLPKEMKVKFVECDSIISDFHIVVLVTLELLNFAPIQTKVTIKMSDVFNNNQKWVTVQALEVTTRHSLAFRVLTPDLFNKV
jgi:hypothetical protein